MNLENINSWILPFISSIAITLAGVAIFFTKIRELSDARSKELISTLEKEVSVYKEQNERLTEENRMLRDSHQIQINELNKQIGELNGRMAELSKQNETLTKILQGKNPEQEKFMKFITEAATISNKTQEDAKNYMETSTKAFEQILLFMKDLHDRNIRVDRKLRKGGGKYG